jgi:hypothetical protein
MRTYGNSDTRDMFGTCWPKLTGGYHMTHGERRHTSRQGSARLTTGVTGNTSLQTQYDHVT